MTHQPMDPTDAFAELGRIKLGEVGLDGERNVYDWRRGTVDDTGTLHAVLEPRQWALWVCAPPGERADSGDLTKYVTVPTDRP